MVHTASHARQKTGKKRKELQRSTKASTIWRITRMYTTVTAAVFHSCNPASQPSEVRTMAYFTFLATGKTLTHQITVL